MRPVFGFTAGNSTWLKTRRRTLSRLNIHRHCSHHYMSEELPRNAIWLPQLFIWIHNPQYQHFFEQYILLERTGTCNAIFSLGFHTFEGKQSALPDKGLTHRDDALWITRIVACQSLWTICVLSITTANCIGAKTAVILVIVENSCRHPLCGFLRNLWIL